VLSLLAISNLDADSKAMFLFALGFVAGAAVLYGAIRLALAWGRVPGHIARMRELMEQQAERDKLRP
jgi:hypothetical protein